MKKTDIAYILQLVLTLFLICAITAGLLAGVNAITKDRIAAAKAQKTLDAIAQVLPDGDSARLLDSFRDETGIVTAVYQSEGGYAVKVAPNGFGGVIDLMVGLDKAGNVLDIAIISHAETPSLGAVAADKGSRGQAFRNQFINYDGQLDAISGATITSKAVEEGVLAAIKCVKEGL